MRFVTKARRISACTSPTQRTWSRRGGLCKLPVRRPHVTHDLTGRRPTAPNERCRQTCRAQGPSSDCSSTATLRSNCADAIKDRSTSPARTAFAYWSRMVSNGHCRACFPTETAEATAASIDAGFSAMGDAAAAVHVTTATARRVFLREPRALENSAQPHRCTQVHASDAPGRRHQRLWRGKPVRPAAVHQGEKTTFQGIV